MLLGACSALAMLDSLEPSSQGFSQTTLRRWQLLRLMAQNKCDTVFRSDSLQLILADYYDKNGTPNERMLSHYLLGRAYVCMGDAPQALRSYQNAAECADTTLKECDWRQLCIIYMQEGFLFFKQYLPKEALASYDEAERIANRCGDKYLLLNALNQKIPAYHELSDIPKVDSITALVHHGFDEMGEKELASRSLATSLYYHIKANDTVKARGQINYLLSHIGREKIETLHEWASFNAYLGNYYLLVHKTDSAELCFRKMLMNDNRLQIKVFAYHGLMDVYQEKGCPDSVYKYTNAYCNANDSSNFFKYGRQLEDINSLYQYDHMEKKMLLSEASSQKKTIILTIVILVSAALLISFYLIYRHKQILSKHKLVMQATRYNDLAEMHHLMSQDMDAMKEEKFDLIYSLEEKDKQLSALVKRMEEYGAVVRHHSSEDPEASEVFKLLHKKATSGKKATTNELQSMRGVVSERASEYAERLKEMDYKMGFKEENICYMIRFGFSASEISVLLGLSPQSLSYFKRKLLDKLFHVDGKASDINDFLCNL